MSLLDLLRRLVAKMSADKLRDVSQCNVLRRLRRDFRTTRGTIVVGARKGGLHSVDFPEILLKHLICQILLLQSLTIAPELLDRVDKVRMGFNVPREFGVEVRFETSLTERMTAVQAARKV